MLLINVLCTTIEIGDTSGTVGVPIFGAADGMPPEAFRNVAEAMAMAVKDIVH